MALTVGSVSINNMGVASGAGLAFELYNARKAARDSSFIVLGLQPPPIAEQLPALRVMALYAHADASAFVAHIVANAELLVHVYGLDSLVFPPDGALQSVGGVDTDPPSTTTSLSGSLT